MSGHASSVRDKAAELVAEGKVTFTATGRNGRPSCARVGAYDVVRRDSRWTCDCAAGHYRQTCSHVLAAEMAAAREV